MTKQVSHSEKWSKLISKKGYVQLPNLLITHTASLGLTSTEFLVLVHILMYKHDKRAPFPSASLLSKTTGKSTKRVYAIVTQLEDKGILVKKRRGYHSNAYVIDPLIKLLERFCVLSTSTQIRDHPYPKSRKLNIPKTSNEKDEVNKNKEKGVIHIDEILQSKRRRPTPLTIDRKSKDLGKYGKLCLQLT